MLLRGLETPHWRQLKANLILENMTEYQTLTLKKLAEFRNSVFKLVLLTKPTNNLCHTRPKSLGKVQGPWYLYDNGN